MKGESNPTQLVPIHPYSEFEILDKSWPFCVSSIARVALFIPFLFRDQNPRPYHPNFKWFTSIYLWDCDHLSSAALTVNYASSSCHSYSELKYTQASSWFKLRDFILNFFQPVPTLSNPFTLQELDLPAFSIRARDNPIQRSQKITNKR
jgi:hypothetical protein